ncbi:SIR2 family protein [Rhizobium binae]
MSAWTCLIHHMLMDLGLPSSFAAANGTTYQKIAEYYRLKHGSLSQLVDWMKREWQISPAQLKNSELHRLIVELDFPLVYTTIYDSNLEMSYETFGRPFTRTTSAKDMATAPAGKTQIVKYHGDFSDPDTLVLTESHYVERLSFDAPLDIKFRSDAFASTLQFIGYSMSDLNIRFLLHHLWSTWRRTELDRHRPPLFLFMHEPTEVQVHVLKRWGVTVLNGDGESSGASLAQFLERLLERRNPDAGGSIFCRSAEPL